MGVAELSLPTLDRKHVEVSNTVATHCVRWSLVATQNAQAHDTESSASAAPPLDISGISPVQHLPANTLCVTILCTKSAERWKLCAKNDDATFLLSHWLQGANIAELPMPLVAAACELWLAHLSSIRPQLSPLVIDSVALIKQSLTVDKADIAVALRCTVQSQTRSLYLVGAALPLQHLLTVHGELKTHTCAPPLALSFICAHTTLTLVELAAIHVGDIVLMPATCAQKLTHCILAINRQPCWLATIDNAHVTLTEPRTTLMTTETPNQPPPQELSDPRATTTAAASGPPVDLTQLPQAIQFELPGENRTISELQALAPGYVFTLQDNAEARVAITANGKTLGRGQLVNIEGRLGVQVREWGQHGS